MNETAPRKRGRPAKPAGERKAHNLTFRTRADFRDRLEQSAAKSGRSVSEEIEIRVERSFEIDHLIRSLDNLCSVFIDNGETARIFVTQIMATIASVQDYRSLDGREVGSRNWSESFPTRIAIRAGIKVLLDHYAAKPKPEDLEGLPQHVLDDISRCRGLAVLGAQMATGQADDIVELIMRQDDATT